MLAIALPAARVALVESVGRKCAFLAAAADGLGVANVEVVNARAEEWAAGLGGQDVVVARALAPLTVLVEYAAPLLEPGGLLVAWKGRRDAAEEADGAAAAEQLGMTPLEAMRGQALPADPRPSSLPQLEGESHAGQYPRRPGMARKRPIRAST